MSAKKKKQIVVRVKYTYDGVEPGEHNTFVFNTKEELDAFEEGLNAGLKGECYSEVE
jgi:hypothetical protein